MPKEVLQCPDTYVEAMCEAESWYNAGSARLTRTTYLEVSKNRDPCEGASMTIMGYKEGPQLCGNSHVEEAELGPKEPSRA